RPSAAFPSVPFPLRAPGSGPIYRTRPPPHLRSPPPEEHHAWSLRICRSRTFACSLVIFVLLPAASIARAAEGSSLSQSARLRHMRPQPLEVEQSQSGKHYVKMHGVTYGHTSFRTHSEERP